MAGTALISAYVSARHLPAGSVGGIRAGSLHTATVSGVNWAIADFMPASSAALKVQAEFQDGASTGIFSQRPGRSWRLVQTGPYGCGRGLPAQLDRAWNLPDQALCQTAIRPDRIAAFAARSRAGQARTAGQSIARIALGQVGSGDTPAVTSFGAVDCDPYSALDGALSPNSDGCGYGAGLGVQDENEAWCADFAKWVWQTAGITAGTSELNAGADSFYEWGVGQHETLRADKGTPEPGDAVVFYPPGTITSASYADHVGLVTGVNKGGTVNLVNGDFLGPQNVTVQYDAKVSLTTWASQVWGPGEQWVLVTPPSGGQQPAPAVTISGPHVAVAGTSVSFSASGTVKGGSVAQYQWTFGNGRTANQAGRDASTIFAVPGVYPVTVTATSSLGTVATRTWDVDVIAASSPVASIPSDAVWYSTTPVSQWLFLPPRASGLAAESAAWAGAINETNWLQQAIPGVPGSGSGLAALTYPDAGAGDATTPHVYFRSSDGTLGETYLGDTGWTTRALAGQPAPGSALAATSGGDPGATSGTAAVPAVFYFNAAGQLSQAVQQDAGWVASTLPGPATTAAGSLALASTAAGGVTGTDVFYLGTHGALTVASDSGGGWRSAAVPAPYGVASGSPLTAVTSAPGQVSVFFADAHGKLDVATQATGSSGRWTVRELPSGTGTASLAATTDLLANGSPGQEVFSLSSAGKPAVTTWNGQQWQTTALPGTGTSIVGATAYPVSAAPQQLFLADGTALTLDQGSGTSWRATTLPDTTATLADRVLLYAATAADAASARKAASAAGLPASQVTQSFDAAWAATLSGNYLVIAVGQDALDALYYNACGWSNPSNDSGGSTPFSLASEPLNRLPGADLYEDGAGATASQTSTLTAALAYYATHGALPAGVTKLPARAKTRSSCAGQAS